MGKKPSTDVIIVTTLRQYHFSQIARGYLHLVLYSVLEIIVTILIALSSLEALPKKKTAQKPTRL